MMISYYRWSAIILFALCLAGISGAAVEHLDNKLTNLTPASPAKPTIPNFDGPHDTTAPDYWRPYFASKAQPAISSPRVIQWQSRRVLENNYQQVVITLQAQDIQVRAKWQVSNAINAFVIDEFGDGVLYLTAEIDNTILIATVYLEDDFQLLNTAYDNLRVATTIQVEIISGTISIIKPRLLYAAAGVPERLHVFLPQGGTRPYQYPPAEVPEGFVYAQGTLSIQAMDEEGEHLVTVKIADADNITATVVATVLVEAPAAVQIQGGNAVFISQGQEQNIDTEDEFVFNPKSNTGVLVSAMAESTVALMAPDNAWAVTIYGDTQASFVGDGAGAVVMSLAGNSDFVRDTEEGATVSLQYVYRRHGVEIIIPVTPIGTQLLFRTYNDEFYLIIAEGAAEIDNGDNINLLALDTGRWDFANHESLQADDFTFADFVATVDYRHTGDVAKVRVNHGVAPNLSLVAPSTIFALGTPGPVIDEYFSSHAVELAIIAAQEGPQTLSLAIVASDHLGDMLGDNYTNRKATVTAVVIIRGIPPDSYFADPITIMQANDVLTGQGITLSITLSSPALDGGATLSVTIMSDNAHYTIAVVGDDDTISCAEDFCVLVIAEGKTATQLHVLTPTEMTLSLVGDTGDYAVIHTWYDVCKRTPLVRTEIMRQARKPCEMVTGADLAIIEGIKLDERNVTSLHAKDFDNLTNLRNLDLYRNALTTLPQGIFAGLTNLQNLRLYNNTLTALPASVFADLSNLQLLYMENNKLTALPASVFAGLTNLQQLRLNNNALTTTLPPGIFDDLVNLRWLILSNNELIVLPRDLFTHLDRLQFLYLDNNPCIFEGQADYLGITANNITWGTGARCPTLNKTQVASFVSSIALLSPAQIATGDGAMISLTLNSVHSEDNFAIAMTVLGGDYNSYTVIAIGDGIAGSCADNRCELMIPPWQWQMQLSVLSQTDLVLSIIGGRDQVQVDTWHDVCARTSPVRDAITVHVGKSCEQVTSIDLAGITEIFLSSVAITSLHAKDFDGLIGLQELDLHGNALITVPASIFVGLPNLRRLNLSHNRLTTVPYNVFAEVTNLAWLDLNNNSLRELPGNLFVGLAKLQRIELQDNLCSFAGQESHLGITNSGVTANFGAGALCLIASFVSKITLLSPAQIAAQNGVMIGLTLNSTVRADNFMVAITVLGGEHNSYTLVVVGDGVAGSCAHATCDLTIPQGQKQAQLSVLSQTDLILSLVIGGSDQVIINTWYDVCERTQQVQDEITRQAGKSCEMVTGTDLAKIEKIMLIDKRITFLHAKDFDSLTNLQELWLSENALTTLPRGIFDGLTKLQELYLDYNTLPTLPQGVFAGLTKLQDLNVEGNNLSTLPLSVFVGLPKLQRLYLSYNNLTTVIDDAFVGLPELQLLNLDNNNLPTLPHSIFDNLTKLEDLILSHNDLRFLPRNLFAPLTNLRMLDLQANYCSFEERKDDLLGRTAVNIIIWGNSRRICPTFKEVQEASFVDSVTLLSRTQSDGVRLSLTLNLVSALDHFTVTMTVLGDNNYTVTVVDDRVGWSCADALCVLIIPPGQGHAQLRVLSQTALTLSLLAGGRGDFVLMVEIPPVASFAGPLTIIQEADVRTGGAMLNITLSAPALAGGLSLLLTIISERDQYTVTALDDSHTIFCVVGACALVIAEGQTVAQLRVLTSNDLTLSLVGGSGEFVIMVAPVAYFVDPMTIRQASNVFTGQGIMLSITLSAPALAGGLALSLTVISDNAHYTITVVGNEGMITCADNACALVIAAGQTGALLSVLTPNNLTLSLVAGRGDYAVIHTWYDVCRRTPSVRDEITRQADTSCEHVIDTELASIINIDVGGHNISALHVGDFDGLANLQYLGLYNNTLSTLPQGVFAGLANLERLYLYNNNLSTLPQGVFAGLTNLRELYLHDNTLSTLPPGLFADLTNLQELFLYRNTLSTLSLSVFAGLTNLQDLFLDNNTLSTLPMSVFADLTNLRSLLLSDNTLSTLPNGVFAGLTKLQYLFLDYNTLSTLPMSVFAGLTNLRSLWLYNNALTTLPLSVFADLTNLQVLYLQNNPCSFVGQESYLGIAHRIRIINLGTGTVCPTSETPTAYFATTMAVITEDDILNGQGVTFSITLSAPALAGVLLSLTIMSDSDQYAVAALGDGHTISCVADACVVVIPEGQTVAQLSVLTSTDMTLSLVAGGSGDFVIMVAKPTASFAGPMTIRQASNVFTGQGINLNITLLAPALAGGLSLSLTIISDNDQYTVTILGDGHTISCVADTCAVVIAAGQTVAQLSVLTPNDMTLSLVGNSGDYAVINTWHDVCGRTQQVRDAIVAEAGTTCELVTDTELADITYLNVRGGDIFFDPNINSLINSLHVGDFADLTNLRSLPLYNTNLSTLPPGIFAGLTNLEHLNLGGNTLSTLPLSVFAGLANLQELNLDNNNLSTLPPGVFAGLTKLRRLNLRHSNLSTLPLSGFAGLTNLQTLYLDQNNLSTLPQGVFADLTQLRVLDLDNNPCSFVLQEDYLGITHQIPNIDLGTGMVCRTLNEAQVAGFVSSITLLSPAQIATNDGAIIPLTLNSVNDAENFTIVLTVLGGSSDNYTVAVVGDGIAGSCAADQCTLIIPPWHWQASLSVLTQTDLVLSMVAGGRDEFVIRVEEIPTMPEAYFVGQEVEVVTGEEATINLTLSSPVLAGGLTLSLIIMSDSDNYTVTVVGDDSISCAGDACVLVLGESRTVAQLSVLTATDLTLSLVSGGSGEFVVWVEIIGKQKIYVLGGYDGTALDDVWSSVDGITWALETDNSNWLARYDHQVLSHNGRLYVLGGYVVTTALNDVWSSADGRSWTRETSGAWSGRFGHQAISHNGRLYVLGGDDGTTALNDVWSSVNGITWELETDNSSWLARYDHQVLSHNGRLYVLGGYDGTTALNDVWSSADGRSWTRETSGAWSGRFGHQAISHNGRLYVLGGYDGGSRFNDVWSSVDGINWESETAASPWSARYDHQVLSHNGLLYVLGGSSGGGIRFNDVWSSVDGKSWTALIAASEWARRSDHQAIVFLPDLLLDGVGERISLFAGEAKNLYTLTAQYGTGHYTYSLLSEIPGFAIGHDGVLLAAGNVAEGDYILKVQVVDDEGAQAQTAVRVRVVPNILYLVETPPVLFINAGITTYFYTLVASGGIGAKTYNLVAGNDNNYFVINSSSGAMSAHAITELGRHTLLVEVSDSAIPPQQITALVMVHVLGATLRVDSGVAVLSEEGVAREIATGATLLFNPRSPDGVLVMAQAGAVVAIDAPNDAWQITLYGGSWASFAGDDISLRGDIYINSSVSLHYVFANVVLPVVAQEARIYNYIYDSEWYLVVDQGTVTVSSTPAEINFLAIEAGQWHHNGTVFKGWPLFITTTDYTRVIIDTRTLQQEPLILLTLRADNIQVRASWQVTSAVDAFSIEDGILSLTEIDGPGTLVATVYVADEFNRLSSAYANLTAQAVITVEVLSGEFTLSPVPPLYAIAGRAESLYTLAASDAEATYTIVAGNENGYFTLADSGILSLLAPLLIGSYTLSVAASDGTSVATASVEVNVVAPLLLSAVPRVTVMAGDVVHTLSASGGIGDKTYTLVEGYGDFVIGAADGILSSQAGAEEGLYTLTLGVIDERGNTAQILATVAVAMLSGAGPLSLLGAGPFTVVASSLDVSLHTFMTSGGIGVKTYTLWAGSDYFSIEGESGVLWVIGHVAEGDYILTCLLSVCPTVMIGNVAEGDYILTVQVVDDEGAQAQTAVRVRVVPNILYLVETPPVLFINAGIATYFYTLVASGGIGAKTYNLVAGNPDGYFAIDSNSGAMFAHAMAVVVGRYTLLVEVSDSATPPQQITALVTVEVSSGEFTLSPVPPLYAIAGRAESLYTLAASDAEATYTIVAGNENGYFTLADSGILSLLAAASIGSYTLSVAASDGTSVATASVEVNVVAPLLLSAVPRVMVVVGDVVHTLSASGGIGDKTYTLLAGDESFVIDAASDILSLPANAEEGLYTLTLGVMDERGNMAHGIATVAVSAALMLSGAPPLTIIASVAMSLHTFKASGGIGAKTYMLAAGDGYFAIDAASGVLSVFADIPPQLYKVTVQVIDERNHLAEAVVTVQFVTVTLLPVLSATGEVVVRDYILVDDEGAPAHTAVRVRVDDSLAPVLGGTTDVAIRVNDAWSLGHSISWRQQNARWGGHDAVKSFANKGNLYVTVSKNDMPYTRLSYASR